MKKRKYYDIFTRNRDIPKIIEKETDEFMKRGKQ